MAIPSIEQGDVSFISQLASATTNYVGYTAAFTAAVALSAANSNAAVQLARVESELLGNTNNLVSRGLPIWLIQLVSTGVTYPQPTAFSAAQALSVANSNAAVYLARVEQQVTAP